MKIGLPLTTSAIIATQARVALFAARVCSSGLMLTTVRICSPSRSPRLNFKEIVMCNPVLLGSMFLAAVVSTANTSKAESGPLIGQDGEPVLTNFPVGRGWAHNEQLAKLALKFDGEAMDDARAASIAANGGYVFVSWQTCPSTGNCMILEVKGEKAGWIFRYVLLGEPCQMELIKGEIRDVPIKSTVRLIRSSRMELTTESQHLICLRSGSDRRSRSRSHLPELSPRMPDLGSLTPK